MATKHNNHGESQESAASPHLALCVIDGYGAILCSSACLLQTHGRDLGRGLGEIGELQERKAQVGRRRRATGWLT